MELTQFLLKQLFKKRGLLKKNENELEFFASAKFVIVHSSTMNPCIRGFKRKRISRQQPRKIFCKVCAHKIEDHNI